MHLTIAIRAKLSFPAKTDKRPNDTFGSEDVGDGGIVIRFGVSLDAPPGEASLPGYDSSVKPFKS